MSTAGAGSTALQPLIVEYLHERVALGQLARSSAEVIRCTLRHFARHVDDDLRRVDRSAVTSWLSGTEVAPTTIKAHLVRLRPFSRWLVIEGHLERDVTLGIPIPRIPERLPRALPPDAVARILAACPDARARLVVILMVQLGLRCNEVASIEMRDIDTNRGVLQVRGKGGLGQVTRAVPFTIEANAELQEYLDHEGHRYSGPLIASQGNFAGEKPVSAHHMSRLVRGWFRAAGVKVHAHDGMSAHALRHTCAQDVADAGADLRHVQELLGHRSLRTTQEYLRLNPPGLREAIEGRSYFDPELTEQNTPRQWACVHCHRPFRVKAGLARHMQARHPTS